MLLTDQLPIVIQQIPKERRFEVEKPSPKDERIIATIDAALAEYDSVVESWRIEDHILCLEATANYEAWLTAEQNGV